LLCNNNNNNNKRAQLALKLRLPDEEATRHLATHPKREAGMHIKKMQKNWFTRSLLRDWITATPY